MPKANATTLLLITVCLLCAVQPAAVQAHRGDADARLQIWRNIDGTLSPVVVGVEERAGNNLTLVCDLSSSDRSAYDDQIIWGRSSTEFKFGNESDLEQIAHANISAMQQFVGEQSVEGSVNRALKHFVALHNNDTGTYFCGSLKYGKFNVVHVIVKPLEDAPPTKLDYPSSVKAWVKIYRRPKEHNLYCNERMFKCKSSDACINPRYVCDKKPDCLDGSDESMETCNGDACANKILCEDGRCIPTAWCCDRHLDANCNVTYRPACCRLLSLSVYDDDDSSSNNGDYYVPFNMTQRAIPHTANRYVFITLCVFATLFSMLLMLLILSKIFLMAKKARCREQYMAQAFHMEDCVFHLTRMSAAQGGGGGVAVGGGRRSGRGVGGRRARSVEGNTATDALLVLSDDILRNMNAAQAVRRRNDDDRPPSYTDVMSLEPPPPYTSQDCLNRT